MKVVTDVALSRVIQNIKSKTDNIILPQLYTHIQNTLSSTWLIQHNLSSNFVDILAIDDNDNEIIGERDLATSTPNLLVYIFSEPITGKAFIKK